MERLGSYKIRSHCLFCALGSRARRARNTNEVRRRAGMRRERRTPAPLTHRAHHRAHPRTSPHQNNELRKKYPQNIPDTLTTNNDIKKSYTLNVQSLYFGEALRIIDLPYEFQTLIRRDSRPK
ncbi:unnamed protein product [Euphydryas editha]|uniref:Uncharacterized protein n=1 Tax=Euphydryas editha TaxID=104508 RepID=A0AAU9VDC0_EUPED|nr:unnamed protein product [Euphydryas editha]